MMIKGTLKVSLKSWRKLSAPLFNFSALNTDYCYRYFIRYKCIQNCPFFFIVTSHITSLSDKKAFPLLYNTYKYILCIDSLQYTSIIDTIHSMLLILIFVMQALRSRAFTIHRNTYLSSHIRPNVISCFSSSDSNSIHCKRDLYHAMEIAKLAAERSGEVMLKTSGNINTIYKTKREDNAQDLVSESDFQCQQIIRETILQEFPNDLFLGEEDDEDSNSDASKMALLQGLLGETHDVGVDIDRFLWIVDPIDGTTNFLSGLPFYCVSIGLVSVPKDGGDPNIVLGVIYNPALKEMICAIKGHGCILNDHRFESKSMLASTIKLQEALVNVGFPVSSKSTLAASSKAVSALSTQVRGIRMIACASQVMSWVAQGKLSAYVSWDLNAWDVAAGMLIVQESGGFVGNFHGTLAKITDRDLVVCSSPTLYAELLKVLQDNDCLEY